MAFAVGIHAGLCTQPVLGRAPAACAVHALRQRNARASRVAGRATKRPQDGESPSIEDTLAEDLARLKAKRAREKQQQGAASDQDESESARARAASFVQTVLVADFFVVLGFLAWLAVAVVKNDDDLYSQWYALWTPLIQPALGVLMLGTIVSGVLGMGKKA
ncbi:hypothetical protein FVE85_3278 [Porphyridium purpureum]|uniref:Uncharacterized protein n=1 Tax=Porphyridium purpureum TaxID=35688 RepID=A0A5J4YX53_PORPP|nr:hypothetical protein FVE85_3278 [Porphyridium purpureum]|eukprot:POR2832..scf227_4